MFRPPSNVRSGNIHWNTVSVGVDEFGSSGGMGKPSAVASSDRVGKD